MSGRVVCEGSIAPPWGALTRSCSSPVLVEEPAKQISSAYLGQLTLAHDRRTGCAPAVEAGVPGVGDARCNA